MPASKWVDSASISQAKTYPSTVKKMMASLNLVFFSLMENKLLTHNFESCEASVIPNTVKKKKKIKGELKIPNSGKKDNLSRR